MAKNVVNIIILGFGLMFILTSFLTMSNIIKIVVENIDHEYPKFHGDGYLGLALVYATFALFNWIAPSLVLLIGPRISMILGSIAYPFYLGQFLYPITWVFYLTSAIVGVGASIMWNGQLTYLVRSSTPSTISRNSVIFWAQMQFSKFIGNLFVYFKLKDQKTKVDKESRSFLIIVLISASVIGSIILFALRLPCFNQVKNEQQEEGNRSCWAIAYTSLTDAVKLLITRDMLILNMPFVYLGFAYSLYSAVYGASVGFTQEFSDSPNSLVGLVGISIGFGELLSGGLIGLLGTKIGRDVIFIFGFIIHIVAIVLIYINLPNNAPFGVTYDTSFLIPPIIGLALFSAFLLGIADGCCHTQIISLLGEAYVDQAVSAFALFKFTQTVAASIGFFYATSMGLHIQLTLLVLFGIVGTASFCAVEWEQGRS